VNGETGVPLNLLKPCYTLGTLYERVAPDRRVGQPMQSPPQVYIDFITTVNISNVSRPLSLNRGPDRGIDLRHVGLHDVAVEHLVVEPVEEGIGVSGNHSHVFSADGVVEEEEEHTLLSFGVQIFEVGWKGN
jgi:hypothetical protein